MELRKYNLEGKQVGSLKVDAQLADATAHSQSIKDYIVALRENARQWSANTKGRSEVAHTTKKPHKQKGTGRARHGSLVGPQFRGGGIVFGPKPKFDQHVRINRKEKRAAIRCLIGEKIRENSLVILDNFQMEKPKTKTIVNFMESAALGKRVLFLGEGENGEIRLGEVKITVSLKSDKHYNFAKSLQNIPKVAFALAKNVNGYDLMLADQVVLTEAAYEEIKQWLL